MNHTKDQKGFTIIEVVLVLAIAALIFLMVFIALPALQRNQRDTARKNDAGVVASAITNYTSNQRKPLRSGDGSELRQYVDKLDQYEVTDVEVRGSLDGDPESRLEKVVVIPGAKCDGNSVDVGGGTSRTAAIVVVLENNGNTYLDYCQDA